MCSEESLRPIIMTPKTKAEFDKALDDYFKRRDLLNKKARRCIIVPIKKDENK